MQQRRFGPSTREALTVSQLTFRLKQAIEGRFGNVTVEGEVLSSRRVGSGHLYFTLRDQQASPPCVMWRSTLQRLGGPPIEDGMRLTAVGDVQVYPPHGRYQLVVSQVQTAGAGDLLARIEALKRTLSAEGLFDASRKHALPSLPRRIGLVTAVPSAALHDVLETLRTRYPVSVLVVPAAVQGPDAPGDLVRAIRALGQRDDVDVILITRGGGSLEDLLAFSDERVVRAIAASPKPVISAVGHEIDTPLSDFAADARAKTPTAAGELLVPRRDDLRLQVAALQQRLVRETRRRLHDRRRTLELARRRLSDPRRHLAERQQLLDDMAGRLESGWRRTAARAHHRSAEAAGRLRNLHPRVRLSASRSELASLEARLGRAAAGALDTRARRLAELRRTLDALGPTGALERGYAIVRRADGAVLRAADAVAPGDSLDVVLHRGALKATVDEVLPLSEGP